MRRPILYSVADRYTVMALNLLLTAVVARLLTPAEVGTFVTGSALLVIADSIRDFGVSVYLIQAREITRDGARTSFTITLISSIVLAALIVAASAPLATFYDSPGVATVLRFAALGLVISPFCAPITALMRRDMAFGKIAFIDVLSAIVNVATVWIMAWRGFGYLSLAWGMLLAAAAGAVAAVALRPQMWIFRPTLREWRSIFTFGGLSSAATLLNTAYQYLPQVALGRILGFNAVGLFSRAAIFCQLTDRGVISALQPVVLPALAARARAGDDLRGAYLHGITLVTAVQWPFLMCLVVMADPMVRLLLGDQWLGAIPLVRLMALAYLFLAPAFMTFPVLVAVGRVRDALTCSLIVVPLATATLIGSAYLGLTAVAASMIVIAPVQMYVAFWFIRRRVPFRWAELAGAIRKSTVMTVATGAACGAALAAINAGMHPLPVVVFAAGTVAAAIGWTAALVWTGHPLLNELGIVWRTLNRAKRSAPQALS